MKHIKAFAKGFRKGIGDTEETVRGLGEFFAFCLTGLVLGILFVAFITALTFLATWRTA